MYYFLIPLLLGFACNSASAFTTAFTRRWGEARDRKLTYILHNFLGIPLWALGLTLAVRAPAPLLFTPTTITTLLGWLIIAGGAALILGAMMAFDMGSPVNKAAYASSVGLLASQIYEPMAAVMVAGMTPAAGPGAGDGALQESFHW